MFSDQFFSGAGRRAALVVSASVLAAALLCGCDQSASSPPSNVGQGAAGETDLNNETGQAK